MITSSEGIKEEIRVFSIWAGFNKETVLGCNLAI